MWKKFRTYFLYDLFGKLRIEACEDSPIKLNDNTVYLIEDWCITFNCPCGCGEIIQLNSLPDSSPKWTYSIKRNSINILPSIRRVKGCKSHFWIKSGKVRWC